MIKKRFFKFALWFILVFSILLNGIAFTHAYKLTHFTNKKLARHSSSKQYTAWQKAAILFTGINNPKPTNRHQPNVPYQTITLQSNKKLHCWLINAADAKGTVILFHGYGGEKSTMLDKATGFLQMGYTTLLVDFMGSGGSEGVQTTIGFKEAENVKSAFEFLKKQKEKNIILFGTSMGAVAIMKAIADYKLQPVAIIIECPFGTMYQTVKARFKAQKIPDFPMAGLLVFWGGVQNNFWAFHHHPVVYAKQITCPALLLYGEKDNRVSKEETAEIFKNLRGIKQVKTYPPAGHENYLVKYKQEWTKDVQQFLLQHSD